jgi:cyanate permease
LLALAPSIEVALAAYALLIGIGLATAGPMSAGVLASNWSQPNPGRAVGIVNMPVLNILLPPLGLTAIELYGLPGFYCMLAAFCALMIPVAWGVRDGPGAQGHTSLAAASPGSASAASEMLPARALLTSPVFLLLVTGAGLIGAVSVIGVAHLVPFAVERGIAAGQAALLLSAMGVAGVVGSPVAGLLCDRLGGLRTLVLMSIALGASWALLSVTTMLPLMIVGALIMGIGGIGIFPSVNVATGHLFGAPTLPRALGLYQLVALPFTALLPPLAGALHDAAGGYGPVAASAVAGCAAMALTYFALSHIVGKRRAIRKIFPVYA